VVVGFREKPTPEELLNDDLFYYLTDSTCELCICKKQSVNSYKKHLSLMPRPSFLTEGLGIRLVTPVTVVRI